MKKLIKFSFTFYLGIGFHIAYSQVSFEHYALTGITIIDANHKTPAPNQTVLISKNVIIDIFADGYKPIPDSFNILKLQNKYLLPGLIDTHVHMATDPSDVDNRPSTLKVLSNMLYSGITSVRDMAGDARTLASLSRDAMTGDIASPNIYYSALMAGPDFFKDPRVVSSSQGIITGQAPYMQAVSDTTDFILAVARAKGTGATGIKLYYDLSLPVVTKIITEAKKQHLKVWGHAWLHPAKPSEIVSAGINSVSHVPLLIYDNFDSIPVSWRAKHTDKFWDDSAHVQSSLFKLMKEDNTILDATLLTYKRAAKDENSRWYNQYQIGKRLIIDAYKAGVKICTGTDDDQEEFVQNEMQLLVKEAGFSSIDVIIAATKTGAEAIGIENTRGTIERNKIADLIVIDKNPLENIENINSVYFVIKEGKVYKR